MDAPVSREEMCHYLDTWAQQVSYTWLSLSVRPQVRVKRGKDAWLRFFEDAPLEHILVAYERVQYCQKHYPL